jgi:hypothetical protein
VVFATPSRCLVFNYLQRCEFMYHHFDTTTAKEDPRISVSDFYLYRVRPETTVMAMTVGDEERYDNDLREANKRRPIGYQRLFFQTNG